MGEMILLTGGSANGKSTFAVNFCRSLPGTRLFVDATPSGESDPRSAALTAALRRSGAFRVLSSAGLQGEISADVILLDCICKLTAAEMFGRDGKMTDPEPAVLAAVRRLRERCRTLVVITNDVGSDGRRYGGGTDAYVRALGRINATLAAEADRVREIVCGIPVAVKGEN